MKMGLDMYLTRTKKVSGLSLDDYIKVDRFIDRVAEVVGGRFNNLNLDYALNLKGANELIPYIKERGECIKWYSVFEEVGYWRKANQIHKWFVDNVQEGEDNCEPYIVSKDQLEALLDTVNKVLENKDLAEELLPTQSGFFFGSTDYDEWYFDQLEATKEIIEKVLSETDFDKEIVIYQSSW